MDIKQGFFVASGVATLLTFGVTLPAEAFSFTGNNVNVELFSNATSLQNSSINVGSSVNFIATNSFVNVAVGNDSITFDFLSNFAVGQGNSLSFLISSIGTAFDFTNTPLVPGINLSRSNTNNDDLRVLLNNALYNNSSDFTIKFASVVSNPPTMPPDAIPTPAAILPIFSSLLIVARRKKQEIC